MKTNEYRKPLGMAFIDYEKMFDSVEIAIVLEEIRKYIVGVVCFRILEHKCRDGTTKNQTTHIKEKNFKQERSQTRMCNITKTVQFMFGRNI